MITFLNKERRFVVLIFIIAFSLRVGYAFLERIIPYIDAAGFDEIARHIAEGKGYRISDGPIENDDAIRWAPGYPFFLGMIYRLFGHNYPAAWVIQSIIGAFTCILIFFIARRLFSRKVAYISAIISTICFNLVIYPAMLLSETLFLLLILLCIIYIYKAEALNLNSRYLFAGILGGLSALTRPVILIFFLFFGFGFPKRNLRGIILFFCPIILLVSFWIARNYSIYQQFIPICSSPGENFWDGHHLKATGKFDIPDEAARDFSIQEYIGMDNLGYRRGLEFITKYPARALSLEFRKASLFFSLARTDGWWPHMKGLDRIFSLGLSLLFNLFIFGLGIAGIVFSYTEKNRYISWMRRFVYINISALMPFIIEARFRLTIYPFMIIFAAYALTKLPEMLPAFSPADSRLIQLSRLAMILFFLLVLNSVYDLFTCMDDWALRLSVLKTGIVNPWHK